MGDYLWAKTGTPDADVAELEEVLRPAAYVPREWTPRRAASSRGRLVLLAAAAAAVALGAFGAVWLAARPTLPSVLVTRLEGAPGIEQRPIGARAELAVNQWLATDS